MLKFIIHPNSPDEQAIEIEARTVLIGSSGENDLILDHESIASHHCRIDEKDGEYAIANLSGKSLEIDGEIVEKKTSLSVGSMLRIGDVSVLFKGQTGTSGDIIEGTLVDDEASEDHALVTTPGGQGAYLPTDSFIQPMTVTPEKASAGMLPLLSLILSILGPVIFGIGLILSLVLSSPMAFFYGFALLMLLVGIVFGFISRAAIRRRGGFLRDQQVASWGLFMSFGWLVVLASVLAYFGLSTSAETRIAKNQEEIKKVLSDLAVSEVYIKNALILDEDDDQKGEYAEMNKLLAVKYARVPKNIKSGGTAHGYRISFHNISEASFLITAIPLTYKNTGLESYYIDEEGFLRGEDIGGQDPTSYREKTQLPKLSQEQSIYEIYEDTLADDIFAQVEDEMRLAEKEPASRAEHFIRARAIADNIRRNFPNSDIVAKLNDIEKATDQVIVDFKAEEDYGKALASLDEGKPLKALEILKRAEQQYPAASNIVDIRDKIDEIRTKHMQELEAQAKKLYDEAKKKELEGDFETAFENYKTIRDKYAETSVAEGIDDLVGGIQAKIKENEAEKYLSELRSLSVEKDFERIISVVEVLGRGYETTDIYSKNSAFISEMSRRAEARVLIARAMTSFKEKDYRSALQTFQKAVESDPDLRAPLRRHLEECYFWVGGYAIQEKDYRKALEYLTAYRSTNPEMTAERQEYLNRALSKVYYEVGKLDYQQGKYKEAEDRLFIAAAAYGNDPEFNYTYGSTLLQRQQYRRAIEALSRCIEDRNLKVKALRKRGYAMIQYGLVLEDELRTVLVSNEEYQYLLDVDKIKSGKSSSPPATGTIDDKSQENGGGDTEEENGDDDDDKSNREKRFFGDDKRSRLHRDDPEDESSRTRILAQESGNSLKAGNEDYPLLRIFGLIEEIEKKKSDLAGEEEEAKGDQQKSHAMELKKTKLINEFEAKFTTMSLSLTTENTNKEKILAYLKAILDYLGQGAQDVNATLQLTVRNREVEEVLAQIQYKRKLLDSARKNLAFALQGDKKLQEQTIKSLRIALDQFKGWEKKMDISRNLRYAALMSPSKEAVANGLNALSTALEVEVDPSVILRSGGVEGD